ncbi:MAG: hypothetical protein E6J62_15960 [Deltaproteobacteria bacterium]|nr:MAG: hypothetical protein E6J85_15280 [Deltaproteobacteria bacterium]TMB29587.1 MAG: hypothetical protein E6J62_15960 [Deltaproteobacteria bacterium]TMB31844.1 MAG: hypothetical protein E6J61_08745 [Deltaproteobacteria bacterium]
MIRGLLRKFFGARRALRSKGPAPHAAPHDPRAAADPWLGSILAQLGDRYRLGEDGADGTRILRRTGRERFNPMQVWLRSAERLVVGEYEVRAHGDPSVALAQARALLDARLSGPLAKLGLAPDREAVEEWGGQVLIRRYQGRLEDAAQAAAAVQFICHSDQIIDTNAE